jgi:hypothetical protein
MMQDDDLSYTEVLDCLEDAKRGLLSPYWQAYAEREIDQLRDADGALPQKAEAVVQELHAVLARTPQINDKELIRREAAARGNELVYMHQGASVDCFVTILYVPQKGAYTASLSLVGLPKETLCLEAQLLREHLLQWWHTQKEFSPSSKLNALGEQKFYATKREAVEFLLERLKQQATL